ncbi:hypothetical protein [Polaribacter reichenbachii]|nr:hypothetical protein [Polaribacter reichenbachii]
MKTRKIILLVCLISIIFQSCESEEGNPPVEERISGKWKLNQIKTIGENGANSFQLKDFSESNIVIEFKDFVDVKQSFELHNTGTYDFTFIYENYFVLDNADLPQNNIIEFDSKRYLVEITETNSNRGLKHLNLTSYNAFKTQLLLEEVK